MNGFLVTTFCLFMHKISGLWTTHIHKTQHQHEDTYQPIPGDWSLLLCFLGKWSPVHFALNTTLDLQSKSRHNTTGLNAFLVEFFLMFKDTELK